MHLVGSIIREIHSTFTVYLSGILSALSDTLSISTVKIHKLMKFGLTCSAELRGTWPLDDTMLHTPYPYSHWKTTSSGFIHHEHGNSSVCQNITLSAYSMVKPQKLYLHMVIRVNMKLFDYLDKFQLLKGT